jgi:predicted enzyme related to lactoylglutathione lyase
VVWEPVSGLLAWAADALLSPHPQMSDLNQKHNRAVWLDIPVANLERACKFYEAVLAVPVHLSELGEFRMGVLDHDQGNGGCLVESPDQVSSEGGLLVYFNAEGRIRDAVSKALAQGGRVLEDTHSIGPHGFRAILLDSEGNRVALHSSTDA